MGLGAGPHPAKQLAGRGGAPAVQGNTRGWGPRSAPVDLIIWGPQPASSRSSSLFRKGKRSCLGGQSRVFTAKRICSPVPRTPAAVRTSPEGPSPAPPETADRPPVCEPVCVCWTKGWDFHPLLRAVVKAVLGMGREGFVGGSGGFQADLCALPPPESADGACPPREGGGGGGERSFSSTFHVLDTALHTLKSLSRAAVLDGGAPETCVLRPACQRSSVFSRASFKANHVTKKALAWVSGSV